jgi:hypothetical protein
MRMSVFERTLVSLQTKQPGELKKRHIAEYGDGDGPAGVQIFIHKSKNNHSM